MKHLVHFYRTDTGRTFCANSSPIGAFERTIYLGAVEVEVPEPKKPPEKHEVMVNFYKDADGEIWGRELDLGWSGARKFAKKLVTITEGEGLAGLHFPGDDLASEEACRG